MERHNIRINYGLKKFIMHTYIDRRTMAILLSGNELLHTIP